MELSEGRVVGVYGSTSVGRHCRFSGVPRDMNMQQYQLCRVCVCVYLQRHMGMDISCSLPVCTQVQDPAHPRQQGQVSWFRIWGLGPERR